jgi:hypothetical protein
VEGVVGGVISITTLQCPATGQLINVGSTDTAASASKITRVSHSSLAATSG